MHPVGIAVGGNGQYGNKDDYIAHHEPFQYYASTANPHHLAPASLAAIGTDTQSYVSGVPQFDKANHQYDMSDFNALVAAISHGFLSPDNLPAVSFLKAPGYQDGHAAYSDPLDEQQFLVESINHLQRLPEWRDTAVVIAYDDSDGWYDHQPPPSCRRRPPPKMRSTARESAVTRRPQPPPTRAAVATARGCRCW